MAQKVTISAPSNIILSGCIFATAACINNRTKTC